MLERSRDHGDSRKKKRVGSSLFLAECFAQCRALKPREMLRDGAVSRKAGHASPSLRHCPRGALENKPFSRLVAPAGLELFHPQCL